MVFRCVVIFLTLSVDCLTAFGQTDPCYFWPQSWYAGRDSCFKSFSGVSATLEEAKAHCEVKERSHLADIRWRQHRDSLLHTMAGVNQTVWLGARGSRTDSAFYWTTDGARVNATLPWWALPVADGYCLVLNILQGLMQPVLCTETHGGFVCQRETQNPCIYSLPGESEYFSDNCFLPLKEKLTLCEAKKKCADRGSFLAEPITHQHIDFLKQFAGRFFTIGDSVQIGCSKTSGSMTYKWSTSGDPINETDWAGEEPRTMADYESVVHMVGGNDWQWGTFRDSTSAYAICQKDIGRECSGVLAAGSCLTLHSTRLAWSEAKAYCEGRGSHLAQLQTELVLGAFNRLLLDAGVEENVLVGAADEDGDGGLLWSFSREIFQGHLEQLGTRSLKYYLAWNTSSQSYIPTELSAPSLFVCQKDFRTYTHTYVVSVPESHATDVEPAADSASLCQPSTPITSTTLLASLSGTLQGDPTSAPLPPAYISVSIRSPPAAPDTGGEEDSPGGLDTGREAVMRGEEGFYHSINLTDLVLQGYDLRNISVLVQTTSPISLVFSIWREESGDVTSVGSSLLYPVAWGNMTRPSFFVHSASADASIGAVSTSVSANRVTFVMSGLNESSTRFHLGQYRLESWFQLSFSTPLAGQYQPAHVKGITGMQRSVFVQPAEDLNVFISGRENSNSDVTFEQCLPVSMVGTGYVTFPSLPADAASDRLDLFYAVAVFDDTLVQAPNQNVSLSKAGDVVSLSLPASGYHHVTGTRPFYLHAHLKATTGTTGHGGAHPASDRPVGVCAVTLLPQALWRSFYAFQVSRPLLLMDVYIALVVRTDGGQSAEPAAAVREAGGAGTQYIPTTCQPVLGTLFSGCYLKLPPKEQLYFIGDHDKPPLAAYMFARRHGAATCHQIGVREESVENTEFDAEIHMAATRTVEFCSVSLETTARPLPVTTESSPSPRPTQQENLVVTPKIINITVEEAEVIAEQIKEELKVNARATSNFRRKKKTVGDFRMASLSLGVVSIVLVSLPFMLMILVDLHTLALYLLKVWHNRARWR